MPQAVRNCYTCKQDLPNSNFKASRTLRSIQDDERITESRAAVASLRNIALRLSQRNAAKRTDSLADLTPPRWTAPVSSSVKILQPAATSVLIRDLAPALPELPRPLLGPFTPGVIDELPSSTPRPGLPTVVLGTPIPRSTHSTAPVVVLDTPIPQESLPPTPSLPP
ncbi:hypothetical protein E5D57_003333 [Metarhizium anisopliae]|nr:hypothetical protein E5D57_003333 [Metarhizium anisopliae]